MRGLRVVATFCVAAVGVHALPQDLVEDEASAVTWEALRVSHTFGRPTRAVVTFKKGVSVSEASQQIVRQAQFSGLSVKQLQNVNAAVLDYPLHSSFEDIRDHFKLIIDEDYIAHIEPDSVVGLPSTLELGALISEEEIRGPMTPSGDGENVPNDPLFGLLWGMTNIRAPEAWYFWTGDEVAAERPIVTVIDTGVDYTHPDLQGNLWVNEAELNGFPGVDDDGNGYIDDVYGWNAVDDNGDPMDDHWHGTHCAGTIGGVGNNGDGVAGVSWGPLIQGCKFLNKSGQGATSDALACLDYSIATGARISSNSWGSFTYSTALLNALALAADAGQIIIAAAGNSGQNIDGIPFYPASYDVDNIVSVAALDMEDKLASFSNYGVESVDIAAPGASIASTFPGGRYAYASGTSMAAPHVSGAMALLLSRHPEFDYTIAKALLRDSIAPIIEAHKLSWGGKMDVAALMTVAGGVVPSAEIGPVVGPSTATCSQVCGMTGMICLEQETSEIHSDLDACLAAVASLPVRAYWAAGTMQASPSYYPAGCFTVHGLNMHLVNINTVGGVGCDAATAEVAKSDRVCICR